MNYEQFRLLAVSEPDEGQEVIVVCNDNSCHVATYRLGKWYVKGPMGAERRLVKKVVMWAQRPQLPEEDFLQEACL